MSQVGSGLGAFLQNGDGRSCWTCMYWEVVWPRPYTATCLQRFPAMKIAHSNPDRGCAFYKRETGSDDEPETAD